MIGERLEIRPIMATAPFDLDIYVKEVVSGVGKPRVPLLVPIYAKTEADARRAMHEALHTSLCDLYAAHLGESLEARAMGAVMEARAQTNAKMVTETEVLSMLGPIADAARRLRQAIKRQEGEHDGLLEVAMKSWVDAGTFRRSLEELCDLPEQLEREGWKPKAGRGPIPKAGDAAYLIFCFIWAWERCMESKVSTASRSRFMRAACELLPHSGVELGDDAEGKIKRHIQRAERTRVAPLSRGR